MKNRLPFSSALIFFGFAALAYAAPPPIRVFIDADKDLIVEYSAAPGETSIDFTDGEANTHEVVRSKFWKSKRWVRAH